jgi:hypothetical protein
VTASLWAFFYDPFTQGRRQLMDIAAIDVQLVGNVVVGHIQPHEIQTQHPHFQGLMMSGNNRVSQIIKACITVMTLIALTGGFRVIKATLDDL